MHANYYAPMKCLWFYPQVANHQNDWQLITKVIRYFLLQGNTASCASWRDHSLYALLMKDVEVSVYARWDGAGGRGRGQGASWSPWCGTRTCTWTVDVLPCGKL